jgi:predicted transcriptional regulator
MRLGLPAGFVCGTGVAGRSPALCRAGSRGTLPEARSAKARESADVHVARFALHYGAVSPAPPPLSLRLGDEGVRALDELARRRRVTRAEAARQAIAEAAARERRRAGLAAEAAALVANPEYVAEAQEVAALMEQLRGPR